MDQEYVKRIGTYFLQYCVYYLFRTLYVLTRFLRHKSLNAFYKLDKCALRASER